jgi:hypothetical protein
LAHAIVLRDIGELRTIVPRIAIDEQVTRRYRMTSLRPN